MRFSIILVLPVVLPAVAMPAGWSSDTAKFLAEIGKQIANIRRQGGPNRPTCDLSDVPLPTTSDPLPPIPEGQRLLAVTVGRGTQNYTCESPEASVKPTARGAVATLFDANCLAANYPTLLNLLPNVALQFGNPAPNSLGPLGSTNIPVAGYHYFSTDTTAVFDMFAFGKAYVKKEGAVDAPVGSLRGVGPAQVGAVPWLCLGAVPENTSQVKTIYRVHTAGGKAPADCSDQPRDVLVQYATQYWMYG